MIQVTDSVNFQLWEERKRPEDRKVEVNSASETASSEKGKTREHVTLQSRPSSSTWTMFFFLAVSSSDTTYGISLLVLWRVLTSHRQLTRQIL